MKISQVLRKRRKAFKISQEELANQLKVSRQTIVKWENGISVPNIHNLIDICDFCNIPINKFQEELSKSTKELIIGTTKNIHDYKLPDYLLKFEKCYPNIKIHVISTDTEKLGKLLAEHKVDIVINYLGNTSFTNHYEFIIEPIGCFHTCFACSKEFYKEEGYQIKNLKVLKKYSQNLIISKQSRRRTELDKILKENHITLDPRMSIHDSMCTVYLVSKSKNIGYFIKEQIENTNLVMLPIKEELPTNPIVIIYSRYSNSIVKKFVKIVVKEKDSQ